MPAVIKIFAIEIVALLLSVISMFLLAFIAAWLADHYYNANHLIGNPVERGDDLGLGLIVIFGIAASLVASLPVAVLIHIKLFKRFYFVASKKAEVLQANSGGETSQRTSAP